MILDGTLLPIDRIAADRPFYSGKHKKHGMNVQVITDPAGRLLWASPALPGAVHDIKAARSHGIIDALDEAGVECWADKGYQGAGGTIRVPYRGRWETLSAGQQAVNRSHAKIRSAHRTGHGHPQDLATPAQAPMLDHPHHPPRPSRPHPPPHLLKLKLEKAHWLLNVPFTDSGEYADEITEGLLVGTVNYPVPTSNYLWPLGDGTWLTADEEALYRWTLPAHTVTAGRRP